MKPYRTLHSLSAKLAAALLLAASPAAARAQESKTPELPFPVPCSLDAWLECPGGRIEFRIDVHAPRGKGGTPTFSMHNGARGEDFVWIEAWNKTPEALQLNIDSYDSHLEFVGMKIDGELRGTWRKLRGPDQWMELPVRARVATAPSPAPAPGAPAPAPGAAPAPGTAPAPGAAPAAPAAPPPPSIAGRWTVKFSGSEDPAVGLFVHPTPETLSGTFLTTLGDYRYLAGRYDADKKLWTLSCFDGAHAFLFKAARQEDGTLAGDFWSGDQSHETWTATKNASAALPDPFGLTKAQGKAELAKLIFTGVDGAKVSLADPPFAGKPMIVALFGTWCPNCHDEAEYLRDLDNAFRSRGLAVVGLAFELGTDEKRNLEQLKRFAARHTTKYPLLLAGKADKAEASKAFPLLDRVRAYPTTIFLRADGTVLAVHQGYAGPAATQDHRKLRQDFEKLINELLGLKAK